MKNPSAQLRENMGGNGPLGFTVLLLIIALFNYLPPAIAFSVILGINLLFGLALVVWVAVMIRAIIEPVKLTDSVNPSSERSITAASALH